jgi:hypothetical protein
MTVLNVSIASTSEVYIGGNGGDGVCSGIIDSVYPNGVAKILGAPPMQAPYVVQELMETRLSELFLRLSPWLSNTCHFALRKYFCSSFMLRPQLLRMRDVLNNSNVSLIGNGSEGGEKGGSVYPVSLLDYEFNLASFPAYSVCVDYMQQCALYFELFDVPAELIPQCDGEEFDSESNKLQPAFPKSKYVALTLNTHQGKSVEVLATPDLFEDARMDSEFKPLCPPGTQTYAHTLS